MGQGGPNQGTRGFLLPFARLHRHRVAHTTIWSHQFTGIIFLCLTTHFHPSLMKPLPPKASFSWKPAVADVFTDPIRYSEEAQKRVCSHDHKRHFCPTIPYSLVTTRGAEQLFSAALAVGFDGFLFQENPNLDRAHTHLFLRFSFLYQYGGVWRFGMGTRNWIMITDSSLFKAQYQAGEDTFSFNEYGAVQ